MWNFRCKKSVIICAECLCKLYWKESTSFDRVPQWRVFSARIVNFYYLDKLGFSYLSSWKDEQFCFFEKLAENRTNYNWRWKYIKKSLLLNVYIYICHNKQCKTHQKWPNLLQNAVLSNMLYKYMHIRHIRNNISCNIAKIKSTHEFSLFDSVGRKKMYTRINVENCINLNCGNDST